MGAENETVLLEKKMNDDYILLEKDMKLLKEYDKKKYYKDYDKMHYHLHLLSQRISCSKKLKKIAEKFSNINLNDYRYSNGTFSVYKTERLLSLPRPIGASSYKVTKGFAHHEGVAIGNELNMLFSDYGVGEDNLEIRFWSSKEPKDNWQKINYEGISRASNDYIVKLFFGEHCKEWVAPLEYNPFYHNCQHYAQKKISLLLEKYFK